MSEIKISVVMAVYNAEKYLREAIESILNQTFADFEFIIVNDGSKDKSLEIIKSFNDESIVLINQENKGLPIALNKGIDNSRSDIIARMDADDISLPDRFQIQYNFLNQNPDYIAVGSNAVIIDINGDYVFTSSKRITDEEIKKRLPESPFIHPTVMFKKKFFIHAGKYSEFMLKGQDTVLFNRMAKYGKFCNMNEPLIKYRVVPTANSVKKNLGNRYSMIQKSAIANNTISRADKIFLKSNIEKRNSNEREAKYHIYLAKKYLWNNYKPKLARNNLLLSLKFDYSFLVFFLYILTFLPKEFIQKVYVKVKGETINQDIAL